MEKNVALGIALGVILGLAVTLVTVHVYKPAMERAAIDYTLAWERSQLPAGAISATIVDASKELVTGAIHSAFEKLPV